MSRVKQAKHQELMDSLDRQVKATRSRSGLTARKDGTIVHRGGAVATPVNAMDGWSNMLTGIGTRADKRAFNRAGWGQVIPEQEVEELYAGDNTARRIVELLPQTALREDLEWTDPDKSKPLNEELKRLQWYEKELEAWIYARLYGGAGIMMNEGTGQRGLDKPLQEGAKIDSLVVLSRWELWAWATEVQKDVTLPDFGMPLQYQIYPRMSFGQVAWPVHASRIIRFDGRRLPRLLYIRNNFWGDSVLTPLVEALGDYKITSSTVAHVLHDFRLMVQKIKGLSTTMNAKGGEAKIKARIEIQNMARSVLGSLLLDGDDDAVFQTGALSGVGECAAIVKEALQALTDIPHSVLFNEGPAGGGLAGAPGDHEERMWYDYVAGQQNSYRRPRINRMIEVIGGYNTGMDLASNPYKFKKLWQLDEKDQSEVDNKNADTDQKYIDLGLRTPKAVQEQRFPAEAKLHPAEDVLVEQVDPADELAQQQAQGDQGGGSAA